MGGDVERRRGENVTAAANANARGVRMYESILYATRILRYVMGHRAPRGSAADEDDDARDGKSFSSARCTPPPRKKLTNQALS